MDNSKAQLIERLQTADNILVTVSANPSVDQLSAAIGLTLMLNKIGKQGTAVFSGKVPSTIEFLQPEKTIEKNTDSLRDFIIALDKSKADKLRYKVEDSHVKIFITPYKTAISEKDLQFSQGDFNVEVVMALGVKDQKDLDRAITAHGRILHDATTISVTNGEPGKLGSIDWDDPKASSLSEMVASLANDLGQDSLDGQIATAFLTGIVAQTERFRNARTSPTTMSISSALMAAGANQQLIATKLEEADEKPLKEEEAEQIEISDEQSGAPDDAGALRIEHEEDEPDELFAGSLAELEEALDAKPESSDETVTDELPEPVEEEKPTGEEIIGGGSLILEPPTLGGKLSANTEPEHLEPPMDSLGIKDDQPPILQRQESSVDSTNSPIDPPQPVDSEPAPDSLDLNPVPIERTVEEDIPQSAAPLEDITPQPEIPPADNFVSQPEVVPEPIQDETPPVPDVGNARDAVSDALNSLGDSQPLPPISALNAQPFDINDQLGNEATQPAADQDFFTVPPAEDLPAAPVDQPLSDFTTPVDVPAPPPLEPVPPVQSTPDFTMPENLVPPAQPQVDATAAPSDSPSAPPSVPPPFPFTPNTPSFDPNSIPQLPQQNNGPQQPPA